MKRILLFMLLIIYISYALANNVNPPLHNYDFVQLRDAIPDLPNDGGSSGSGSGTQYPHFSQDYQSAESKVKGIFSDVENLINNANPSANILCAPVSKNDIHKYISVSVIAMVIILFFGIIVYMVSKSIGVNPEPFFKLGIEEAIVSVLILITFISLTLFVTNGGNLTDYSMYNSAMKFVKEGLTKTVSYTLALSIINFIVSMLYMFSIPIPIGGTFDVGISINVGVSIKPLVDAVGFSMKALGLTLGEWIARYEVLCMLPDFTYYILLPLGILFRFFSVSKGAGNAMIALAFSLFFFYPMVVHISYSIYKSDYIIVKDTFDDPVALILYKLRGWLTTISGIIILISGFLLASSGGITSSTIGFLIRRIVGLFLPPLVAFFASFLLPYLFNIITSVYHFIVIYGLILPALNIFITLTLAKEISKFLGSPIDLGAFAKLL